MTSISTSYIEIHLCHLSDKTRRYLLLKRATNNKIYPGIWQMITATKEKREKTKETIIREIKEETSLKPVKIYVIPKINSFYLAVNDTICMSPVFLAIVDDKNVSISDEHDEFKWVTFENARKLIYWDNQIDSMEIIERFFKNKKLFSKLVEIK